MSKGKEHGCLAQFAGAVFGLALLGFCVVSGAYWLAQADIEPSTLPEEPATQPDDASPQADESSTEADEPLRAVADDGRQQKRLDLLRQAKDADVIDFWAYDYPYPVVYVKRGFFALTRKQRNKTLGALYQYWNIKKGEWGYNDRSISPDSIHVKRDDATQGGQTLGWYDPVDGYQRE